jgi:tRNA threonylcarbamoyladenosine biosynthesis protein TsaB
MIDARRMEVYTAVLNKNFEWIENPFAKIITDSFIADCKLDDKIYVGGNGAFKLNNFEIDNNVVVLTDSFCEAKYLTIKTNELFKQQAFADVAYCEPFYLKQFGEIL